MIDLTTVWIILWIIVNHWIADFIFQDEQWALGKSKSLIPLLKHTVTYSLYWVFVMGVFCIIYSIDSDLLFNLIILFPLITFVFHTITDYFTSKKVSRQFEQNHLGSSIPNLGAFTSIGFDQVLHYVQLLLTFYILT